MSEVLELLEELLSITAQFMPQMKHEDLRAWQRISAKCADLRDGEEV